MNNIKGYSHRPNYLEFDNGKSQIEMIFGKMVIKGLLFGDREFNYEEKSTFLFIQFMLTIRPITYFQKSFMALGKGNSLRARMILWILSMVKF